MVRAHCATTAGGQLGVESGVIPIDADYPGRQPVVIRSARQQEMEAVIMFAIIALVLLALVALTVLGFAVHVLFWPLLLVAAGILAWTRLGPGRAGR